MKRNISSFFLVIAITACPSLLWAQTGVPEGNQQFEGFSLSGYGESKQKQWDIKGDTAQIDGNEVEITNVDANAYGDEDMNVKAKKGMIDKQNGNMRLKDDVVITTETGTKMVTDSVEWQKGNDLITTEDEVVITRDTMKAVGTGITAHPKKNEAQLNRDVTVEYQPPPGEETVGLVTVTCEGPMEINYKDQNAVFNTHVVATESDRKLMADKMTLFFDNGTKTITEMICEGNVSITQGENTSYAQKAVYKAKDQTIVLSGRPKLLLYLDGDEGQDVPFGN